MQEMQFQSQSREDTLEEEMATDSSIVAWREEPGGLQSMGSQRVEYDLPPSMPLLKSVMGFHVLMCKGGQYINILVNEKSMFTMQCDSIIPCL